MSRFILLSRSLVRAARRWPRRWRRLPRWRWRRFSRRRWRFPRWRRIRAAAADSAAAHADLAVALIVAVLIQAERVPLAVRDIAEAHTAAVTGGTAAGRTEADREDTREARIEARRSPVAVALQVARCDPRMHRRAIADGQWHSFGGASRGNSAFAGSRGAGNGQAAGMRNASAAIADGGWHSFGSGGGARGGEMTVRSSAARSAAPNAAISSGRGASSFAANRSMGATAGRSFNNPRFGQNASLSAGSTIARSGGALSSGTGGRGFDSFGNRGFGGFGSTRVWWVRWTRLRFRPRLGRLGLGRRMGRLGLELGLGIRIWLGLARMGLGLRLALRVGSLLVQPVLELG